MAKSSVSPHDSRHVKGFKDTVTSFSGKHNPYQIFRDFVSLAARAISNQQFFFQQLLEDEYLAIAGKYTKDELDKVCKLLAITTIALSEQHQDFLGHCYMSLDYGNAHAGQFFTPYSMSSLMAGLQLAGMEALPEKGFITVQEPALGAGGMLIAFAEAFQCKGFNTQTQLFCSGIEIDQMVAEMAYIQLSILDIPAEVCVGNTLSQKINRRYFTPAYLRYDWFSKLADREPDVIEHRNLSKEDIHAKVESLIELATNVEDVPDRVEAVTNKVERRAVVLAANEQFALF